MDPLSQALETHHGPCDIARGFTAGDDPWALRFDSRHGVRLPMAVRGACWVIVDGREPLRLDEGDVAVPSGAVPFVLASDPAVPPRDADEVFDADPAPVLPLGGTGVAGITRLMRPAPEELVLSALPVVTHIRAADPVRHLFDRVLEELAHPGPGSAFAGEQYAQLLLLDVLRAALDARDVPEAGEVRLHSDEELRPALDLMREQPAYPWRLADLAKAVSMSRSAFASRFRAVSGEPPLTYLQRQRIDRARAALRDTDATLAELAGEMGYGSATAFSHAFTRAAGLSPAHYRALHRS